MTAPQDPFSTPPQGSGTPGGVPAGPPSGDAPGYGAPQYGQPAYGQAPYGQPAFGTGPGGPARNGLGVAALVLGILALLTGWLIIGGLLGIVAIILGFVGRGRAKRGEATNGGMALAGIILGVLGLLSTIAIFAIGASFLNSESGQNLQQCLIEAAGDPNAEAECQAEFQEELTN